MERGERMSGCQASMVSYTQANRGRRLLQRRGIFSEIHRLERIGPEGCGYVLEAAASCQTVQEILERNGITAKRLQKE